MTKNESVLLEYASQRRFFHHDNETRFLLMGQQYPTEVEKYLSKYGKDISLTDDEEFNVVERNKNALQHLKVQSLAVYRDYVLPEKRKKNIPFSEEDLPMLIRLSYDNPLLIEEFIDEHGRLSPEYEAELFFKAEEKCREKYIKLYGVDLRKLVEYAVYYGATEIEQELIKLSHIIILSEKFTILKKWRNFDIDSVLRTDIYNFNIMVLKLKRVDWLPKSSDYSKLKESLTIDLPVLINIARRNYLLGAG